MQVTETAAAGLKRELKVVIPQSELGQRFGERLETVKGQVQIKGFRPGKVPAAHVKKLYGRSLMAEVLQQMLDETSRKAIADRKERPAYQPDIKMTEDKSEIENIMSGNADLAYTMAFEVLPEIALAEFTGIKLEREVAPVGDADIQKGLDDLAERSVTHTDEPRPRRRDRRPRHDRFRRQGRRRRIPWRQGHRRAGRAGTGRIHPGLRRRPDRCQGRRHADYHGDFPCRLSERSRSPARRRRSMLQ